MVNDFAGLNTNSVSLAGGTVSAGPPAVPAPASKSNTGAIAGGAAGGAVAAVILAGTHPPLYPDCSTFMPPSL